MPAIGAVRVFEFVQFDAEGLLHCSSRSRQGHGAAHHFVPTFKYLKIVFFGKLANLVHGCRIRAIGLRKVRVGDLLADLARRGQRSAMLEDDGNFDELMRVGWTNRTNSGKSTMFRTGKRNPFGIGHDTLSF